MARGELGWVESGVGMAEGGGGACSGSYSRKCGRGEIAFGSEAKMDLDLGM